MFHGFGRREWVKVHIPQRRAPLGDISVESHSAREIVSEDQIS